MKQIVLLVFIYLIINLNAFCQDQLYLTGDNVPATDTVWVFVPQSYADTTAYPIVYMLHGYSGTYQQWHNIMNAQQYADEYSMIIVSPDGFYNSWYLNSPGLENSQYADFFFEKVVPEIEAQYSVDTNNRFITGLSMGGHGAFHLYLQHPEMFRSAGSTSGVLDLRGSADSYELKDHLGSISEGDSLWLSFSAIGNIAKFKQTGKELIFDCGTEDIFYECNKEFYEKCLESKIPVTFISRPGGHNSIYWKESIRSHFEFFKSKIN